MDQLTNKSSKIFRSAVHICNKKVKEISSLNVREMFQKGNVDTCSSLSRKKFAQTCSNWQYRFFPREMLQ